MISISLVNINRVLTYCIKNNYYHLPLIFGIYKCSIVLGFLIYYTYKTDRVIKCLFYYTYNTVRV